MVKPTDQLVLNTLRHAPILILHIHGEKDTHFDLLKDYDCDAISWEDQLAGPSITEAREKTDKCFVGGIDHVAAVKCTPNEVVRQGREAVENAEGRGIILAPGCTFFNDTPPENILALKAAVGA
jgi:uroporphyrinogen decarboxylase